MCRLSWNLGASTFWNPLGLSRPVMGLLYLYLHKALRKKKKLFSYQLNNNLSDAHKTHAFTFLSDILKRAELRETPKSDSAHPTGFHACILDTNLLSKIKTINASRLKALQKHVQLKTACWTACVCHVVTPLTLDKCRFRALTHIAALRLTNKNAT